MTATSSTAPPPGGDGLLRGRRVVIAGGRGFLGLGLADALQQHGAEVVLLSRTAGDDFALDDVAMRGPQPRATQPQVVQWDGRSLGDWTDQLRGAAALVNLCGRSVDCIKTPDHCDQILRSRVESTRLLGRACEQLGEAAPPVWVQMSTAHIYGDPPVERCDESSAFGFGLAPIVGQAWEQALAAAIEPLRRAGQPIREVRLRTSFVIGRDRGAGGGALATLVRLARWGLGGRVGQGRQGFSWLHEDDLAAIVLRAIAEPATGQPAMEGAYIVSSPQPVSQAEFMQTLRQVVGMPIGLPTPVWAVRLGAKLVLRTDPELAIYGRYVIPRRLLDEGFGFAFPELGPALDDLLTDR